jgi:hypothetical protein
MLFLLLCYPLLTAALWRLGGGALTTLTGFSLGTDGARALRSLCALVLAAAYFPWGLLAVPLLFLSLLVGGEGAFQGMGLPVPPGQLPESSWMRWLPEALGFKYATLPHDAIGMLEVGIVMAAPISALLFFLGGPWPASAALLAAPLFPLSYMLARLVPWSVPNFAAGQAWGELFAGFALGAALAGAALC